MAEKKRKRRKRFKKAKGEEVHKNGAAVKKLQCINGGHSAKEMRQDVPESQKGSHEAIQELHEKLSHHSFALRAFGALLETSNLNEFSDNSSPQAEDLRYGLAQIIDLYLARQQHLIAGTLPKNSNDDRGQLLWAQVTMDHVREGYYNTKEAALQDMHKVSVTLNELIRKSSEYGDRAQELKDECRDVRRTLRSM